MDRLRAYLHAEVMPSRLADVEALEALGWRGRWIPTDLEFEEIELARPLDPGRDLILTVALEQGKVARILVVSAPTGDDDADARAFTEEGLAAALAVHGEACRAALAHLTGS